jgi:RHS repeat-associated protein
MYTWDIRGRLKTVAMPNGETVNYNYDALGRRTSRTSNNQTTNFVYDGQDVVQDKQGSNNVNYLNGLGIDNKLKVDNKYFLKDHLGSTIGLINSSGNLVESQKYEAFGRATGSLSTRYGYTGREYDADTKLNYYRARWYDAEQGRFISSDPIGFQAGENFYSYVSNKPITANDPSGLQGESSFPPTTLDKDDCQDESCKKDAEVMISLFYDTVVWMNENGRRVQGSGKAWGWFNNFSSSVNAIGNFLSEKIAGRRPFVEVEGCIIQADLMKEVLEANKHRLKNKWDFDIGNDYKLGISFHKWVKATPRSNQKCPTLRFDTWANFWSVLNKGQ